MRRVGGTDERPAAESPLEGFGDKIAAFRALGGDDDSAADRVLQSLSDAHGTVDRRILAEIEDRPPIANPGQFEPAHHAVMHGLEVLYRNGHLAGELKSFSVLAPVVRLLQQLVTRYVVRSHINNVIEALTRLYIARESQTSRDDPALPSLRRARIQMERLENRLKGKAIGLPGFLVGGVALSTGATLLGNAVRTVTGDSVVLLVTTATILAVTILLGWALLRSAGIARRRITMTVEAPLDWLYRVIGQAGEPSPDRSKQVALTAFIVMTIVWLIIPAALAFVYFN